MSGPVSPLVLERYELKYLIPVELVEPISQYVEAFCEMDYYSQISGDNYYTINSLYLDTPSHYIFRSKDFTNAYNFNMRVRSYGTSPKPPYYFEIKYKLRDFVTKKRSKILTEDWPEMLQTGEIPPLADEGSLQNLKDFIFMAQTYNVEPKILTHYRRKAYLSMIDDYARVTFDRDLKFQEMTDWVVKPDFSVMSNYDVPDYFEEPGQKIVLELKCEKKIPLWMVDLIQRFDLSLGSFSKYGNSLTTMHQIPEVLVPGPLYR